MKIWRNLAGLIAPERAIPDHYRKEYLERLQGFFRQRVRVLAYATGSIYLIVFLLVTWVGSYVSLLHRTMVMSAVTGSVWLCLKLNRRAKTLSQIKAIAFGHIAAVLSALTLGALPYPETFNYATYILSLFFVSLILPWFFRDLSILVMMHFGAWLFYFQTRDWKVLNIPDDFFGQDPFIQGSALLGLASLVCLIVGQKTNERDIENFILFKDLEVRKTAMDRELEFAARVQTTLIPQSFECAYAQVAVHFQPVGSVGGDYAKVQVLDENRLVFFISDVTGHGVPAALLVNRLHAEFNGLIRDVYSPGQILRNLNNFILKDFEGSHLYLSGFCGVINFAEKRIWYSSYGHPTQYLCRIRQQEISSLRSHTTLLGVVAQGSQPCYEQELDYASGDSILLFTDGVIELRNDQKEEFGEERLKRLVRENAQVHPQELNRRLIAALEKYSGGTFRDDVILLSIKLK